jgi:hypothetical protein
MRNFTVPFPCHILLERSNQGGLDGQDMQEERAYRILTGKPEGK